MTPRAQCFYCESPLGQRREYDHAPVPRNVGGVETVAACSPCHHLKDSMNAGDWPLPAYLLACKDLVERGLLAGDFTAWPDSWHDLSRETRIMWAKIAREANRGEPLPFAVRA